jgi:chaperonin GroES
VLIAYHMAKTTKKLTKKLNVHPTPGYIVIEPMEAAKQTASGIYLPDTASPDKPQKGTVLALGEDEVTEKGTTKKSPVKVGDIVIYKKWGGSEVKIEGKEYLFARFDDILATEK